MAKDKRKREREEIDTETSFADMNVEGFSWYDPKRKNKERQSVDKKEFWPMVFGALRAYIPVFVIIACIGIIIYLLARLWLGQ